MKNIFGSCKDIKIKRYGISIRKKKVLSLNLVIDAENDITLPIRRKM